MRWNTATAWLLGLAGNGHVLCFPTAYVVSGWAPQLDMRIARFNRTLKALDHEDLRPDKGQT